MGQHLGQQNRRVQMQRHFRLERLILRQDLSQQPTTLQLVRIRMELRLTVLLLNRMGRQMGRQMVQHYQPRRTALLSRQPELIRRASLSPRLLERRHQLEHGKQHRW
jgi:hypothetical protein